MLFVDIINMYVKIRILKRNDLQNEFSNRYDERQFQPVQECCYPV